MVDLYAAEAYLVIATPVALKLAMEQMIPKHIATSVGFSLSSWKANLESSITPLSHMPSMLQLTC